MYSLDENAIMKIRKEGFTQGCCGLNSTIYRLSSSPLLQRKVKRQVRHTPRKTHCCTVAGVNNGFQCSHAMVAVVAPVAAPLVALVLVGSNNFIVRLPMHTVTRRA